MELRTISVRKGHKHFANHRFLCKPNWYPRDKEHMRIVKEALYFSTVPSTVSCRETEQKKVLEFCKSYIEQEKAGSLYVSGCPGTGKSLSMEKVKQLLLNWAGEILGIHQPQNKGNGNTCLQLLQKLYSQKPQSDGTKMMLIVADELDYLITKDRAVLTTYPFSRYILLGVANAIDLADSFLPKLQSLNCKPMVITFRAYSKDQILKILQERLMALPYTVFQPYALELCARKVAAASGDMRKALCISRSAIEMLEAEVRESTDKSNSLTLENPLQQTTPALPLMKKTRR